MSNSEFRPSYSQWPTLPQGGFQPAQVDGTDLGPGASTAGGATAGGATAEGGASAAKGAAAATNPYATDPYATPAAGSPYATAPDPYATAPDPYATPAAGSPYATAPASAAWQQPAPVQGPFGQRAQDPYAAGPWTTTTTDPAADPSVAWAQPQTQQMAPYQPTIVSPDQAPARTPLEERQRRTERTIRRVGWVLAIIGVIAFDMPWWLIMLAVFVLPVVASSIAKSVK